MQAQADTAAAARRAHVRAVVVALRDATVTSGAATARHTSTAPGTPAAPESAAPPIALTVAEVADRTGLSRPTADAILRDLVERGPVQDAGQASTNAPGRPARRFRFDPSAAVLAAVDIGAQGTRCRLVDAAGHTFADRTAPAPTGSDPAAGAPASSTRRLDAVEDLIRALCAEHAAPTPAAIGLAVPGILAVDGAVRHSLVVPDLVGTQPGTLLGERLGCPVVIENDVKLAAYAELQLGSGASSVALFEIGHRISLALVLGGRILQGHHRLAGELGTQRGMRWSETSDRGELSWSTGAEAEPLFARAAGGDPEARAEIDRFCAQIAPRIAGTILTVDPELVVIGGGLSRAGDTLLTPLTRHVHRLLTVDARPELVPALLHTDGAVIGAVGRAFEEFSEQLVGIDAVPPPWHTQHPPTTVHDQNSPTTTKDAP